jgi:hypothetical protein
MPGYTDLELSLHHHDASSCAVEFHFSQPDSDADIRLGQGASGPPALAQFDFEALRSMAADPSAYGKALTQSLFADPAIQTAFAQARASTETAGAALRLKLIVGPSAPALHSLRWETLRDPQNLAAPLCTGENLLFSRYLSSLDWRPVRLRPKGDLRALVVIANPANLADYGLAAVDVEGELSRAKAGLGEIPVTVIPDGGKPASLSNLIASLRDGGGTRAYDILYLVCHGALAKEEAWLWLENEAGKVGRASGTDFVTRLKELSERPRLVVLASCQSAGTGAGDALSALGPRLAESGIPAVVAMQGSITMETAAKFMRSFFEELQEDGQIDRALAVARGGVRDRPDYWMPALFMRLKSGRIWYVPGFGDERQGFEKWPSLMRAIKKGQCTPILGAGLSETLLGASREIAQRWAEAYHYPMEPHQREDLPQVAQYLAINQDRGFPRDELEEYLRQQLLQRYAADLPENLRTNPKAPLNDLIDAVGLKRWEREPRDPYKVLAALPLPIYVTTNADRLLLKALEAAGKSPQVALCPWNKYVEQADSIYDKEPNYLPSPEKPLVYYLYGRLGEPDSLVLTEDDYFDFLIGVTSNKDLIPAAVRRALADTALLFLGFQVDSWDFRVLFRSILSGEGGGRRSRYAHIAAQIEPEEGRILEPERARRYLENYISKGADISLYWGGPEDFAAELQKQWTSRQ